MCIGSSSSSSKSTSNSDSCGNGPSTLTTPIDSTTSTPSSFSSSTSSESVSNDLLFDHDDNNNKNKQTYLRHHEELLKSTATTTTTMATTKMEQYKKQQQQQKHQQKSNKKIQNDNDDDNDITSDKNNRIPSTISMMILSFLVRTMESIFLYSVWFGMILVPYVLTMEITTTTTPSTSLPESISTTTLPLYQYLFRPEWYEYNNDNNNNNNHVSNAEMVVDSIMMNTTTTSSFYDSSSSPTSTGTTRPPPFLGLFLGILTVAIGQMGTWIFFYYYRFYSIQRNSTTTTSTTTTTTATSTSTTNRIDESSLQQQQKQKQRSYPIPVQTQGVIPYDFWDGLKIHISQPEGFGLLVSYLTITWYYKLLPNSYYDFHGTIQYEKVLYCLLVQDFIQYIMHRMEHGISPKLYQISHKPHHIFKNPKLFDAFNGSMGDTILMIILPLYTTAQIMNTVNVWTYMCFGSVYACWLTLIHSEYILPWETILFQKIGLGTSSDHHVHHKFFKYNYGHLFMYWDYLCQTYKHPHYDYGTKVFNHHS